MFGEKLSEAIKAAGVNPSELSRRIGCDRSNLSRMCSGARVPKKSAAASRRVVDAICAAAAETDGAAALGALIGFSGETAAELKQCLMDWLYEGVALAPAKPRRSRKTAPYATFGSRLNAVMELAELSNVRFGKLLNLDASYISRFRSGMRSPASNPQMMDDICHVLLKLLQEQDKLGEFASLVNAPSGSDIGGEEAFFTLREWLFDVGRDVNTPIIGRLLENISGGVPDVGEPLSLPADAKPVQVPEGGKRVYYRIDGLRAAAERLLSIALERGSKQIYLYTDQSMQWLNGNEEYNKQIFALLAACMRGGARITIIHNIDRAPVDMFAAISGWLPLYIIGRISSYYFTKQTKSRFSYTLLLCPDFACVEGGGVVGHEDVHGIYRFDTDPELLAVHKNAFDAMIENAKPLVSVYEHDDADRLAVMGSGGITVVGSGLPLTAIPEGTLKSLLEHGGVSDEERGRALSLWRARRGVVERNLQSGFLHLCGTLADEALVSTDKAPAAFPGTEFRYTKKEYAEHVGGLMELMDNFPNFRFYVLPKMPFEDMQITVAENAVAAIRLKPPCVSFLISHPLIREAFAAYVEKIKESCLMTTADVRRALEKYICP